MSLGRNYPELSGTSVNVAQARHASVPGSGRGLDVPEAVGAVDRLVLARLERHLGGVAALRADDREVLALWPVIAALIAAWPTDLAHVKAARLTHLAARGAA